MIVGFQPGGTIKSVRVILRATETLPNKFNTLEAEIYREDPNDFRNMLLIKPVGSVLPVDSDLLTQPDMLESSILDLTLPVEGDITFKHVDIIQMDEDEDSAVDDHSG